MDQSPASWIDIASPVVTFVLVILVPIAVAAWVIVKTVTDKAPPASAAPAGPTAASADNDSEVE